MQMLCLGASLFQHLKLEQIVNDDKKKKKSADTEIEDMGRNSTPVTSGMYIRGKN